MEIQILCITKIALWGGGNRPQRGFIWGETALWGRPPYGGDRPQRGFIKRLLRGY
jgi:hypothetical protein